MNQQWRPQQQQQPQFQFAQQTGFQPQQQPQQQQMPAFLNTQPTGFMGANPQMQRPMQTGFMQPQVTGFPGMGGVAGLQQQPQQTGLQSQPGSTLLNPQQQQQLQQQRFLSPSPAIAPQQTGWQSGGGGLGVPGGMGGGGLVPQMTGYIDPRMQLMTSTFMPTFAASGAPQFQQNPNGGINLQQSLAQHNQMTRGTTTPKISWALSKDERKNYDQIFRAWDASGTGLISGSKAIEVFGQSGIDQDDLAKIWQLADATNRGSLNLAEFHVAMGLIYRRLSGHPIPEVLPPELVPPSERDLDSSVNFLKDILAKDSHERASNGSAGPTPNYSKSRTLYDSSPSGAASSRKDGAAYVFNESDVKGHKSSARHLDRKTVRYGGESAADDLNEMKRQLQNTASKLDRDAEEVSRRTEEDDALDDEMDDLKYKVKRVQEDLDRVSHSRGPRSAKKDEERRKLERELMELMHEKIPAVERKIEEREERRKEEKERWARERNKRNDSSRHDDHYSSRYERDRDYGRDRDYDRDSDRDYERERERERGFLRGTFDRNDRDRDRDRDRHRDRSRDRRDSYDRDRDRDRDREYARTRSPPTARSPPPAPPPAPASPARVAAAPTPTPSTISASTKNMTPAERQAFIRAEAQRRMQERMQALGVTSPSPSAPSGGAAVDGGVEERLAQERKEAEAKAKEAEKEAEEREKARRARLEAASGLKNPPTPTPAPPALTPPVVSPPPAPPPVKNGTNIKPTPPMKPKAPPPPVRKPGASRGVPAPPPASHPAPPPVPAPVPPAPTPIPAPIVPPENEREAEARRQKEAELRQREEALKARLRELERQEEEARLQEEQFQARKNAFQAARNVAESTPVQPVSKVAPSAASPPVPRSSSSARTAPPPPASRARPPPAAPTPPAPAAPRAPVASSTPTAPPAPTHPAASTPSSTNPFHKMQGSNTPSIASSPPSVTSPPIASGANNPFFKPQQPVAAPTPVQPPSVPKVVPVSIFKPPTPAAPSTTPRQAVPLPQSAESDEEWDVPKEKDDDDDSSDEDEYATRGAFGKLADQLFGGGGGSGISRPTSAAAVSRPPNVPTPPTGPTSAPPGPAPSLPLASAEIPAAPAPPPPPPPPAPVLAAPVPALGAPDAHIPPPPPPPPAAPVAPPPAATEGRSALLSAIQGGARLKKAVTNDRSTSQFAGAVVGSVAPPSHIADAPRDYSITSSDVPTSYPLSNQESDDAAMSNTSTMRQSVDWYAGLAADGMQKMLSAIPGLSSTKEEEEAEESKPTFQNELGSIPAISVADVDSNGGLPEDVDGRVEYRVRTLYTYEGQRPEDISFAENLIINANPTKSDEAWMYGTVAKDGSTGFFPSSYVQVLNNVIQAKALYDYIASTPEELSFNEGESISIIDQSDADWWKTEKGGVVLNVPAGYLELTHG